MSGSPDTPAWSVVLSQTEQAGIAYTHQVFDTSAALTTFLAAAQKNSMPVLSGPPGRIPPATSTKSLAYLDLSGMTQVLEYEVADQVVHAEVGISLKALDELLAKNKQRLAVDVPENWTLLDLLNSGRAGTLTHAYGGVRDIVLGCTVALADGTVIKCGGKVVKNVTGYDMGKLFVGSRGWLGIPVSAYLRLHARPETSRTLSWSFDSSADAVTHAKNLIKSGLPFARLELLRHAQSNHTTLLAQAQGLPLVVDEVCHEADERFSGAKSAVELKDDAEREQWSNICSTFMQVADDQIVQMNLPMTSMHALLDALSKYGALQATPARGQMSLRLNDPAKLKEVIDQVSLVANRDAIKIVIATGDQSFNYRVTTVPGDPVGANLKERLKKRFDQSGILNPFVSL